MINEFLEIHTKYILLDVAEADSFEIPHRVEVFLAYVLSEKL